LEFRPVEFVQTKAPAASAYRGLGHGKGYFTRSMNVRSTVFTRIFCPASM